MPGALGTIILTNCQCTFPIPFGCILHEHYTYHTHLICVWMRFRAGMSKALKLSFISFSFVRMCSCIARMALIIIYWNTRDNASLIYISITDDVKWGLNHSPVGFGFVSACAPNSFSRRVEVEQRRRARRRNKTTTWKSRKTHLNATPTVYTTCSAQDVCRIHTCLIYKYQTLIAAMEHANNCPLSIRHEACKH